MEVSKICQELRDKYSLELDQEFRQVSFYKGIPGALIMCIVAVIGVSLLLALINGGNPIGIIMLIIGAVIGIVLVMVVVNQFTYKQIASFRTKYVSTVGKDLLKRFYTDVDMYDTNKFNYVVLYKDVGYDGDFNINKSYDQVEMKYKDKNIKLMNILLEKGTGGDSGITHTNRVFCGLFAEVELGYKIGTRMAISSSKWKPADKLKCKELIEMDNKEFEDFFDVYTNDKGITTRLLSPEVMNVLKQMFQSVEEGFDIVFNDGKMYVRIALDKPLFEFDENELIHQDAINRDVQALYLLSAIIDNIDYAVEANHILQDMR